MWTEACSGQSSHQHSPTRGFRRVLARQDLCSPLLCTLCKVRDHLVSQERLRENLGIPLQQCWSEPSPYTHMEWSSTTDLEPWTQGPDTSPETPLGLRLGKQVPGCRKWIPQAPAHHLQRQGIFLYLPLGAVSFPGEGDRCRWWVGLSEEWAMLIQDWHGRGGCQGVSGGIGLHSRETRPERAASEKGRAFVCSGGELQPPASLCLPADLIWAFVWEAP